MMLIITLMSLLLSGYLTLQVVLGRNSKKWPYVEGKISSYNVKTIKRYSKFPSMNGTDNICILKLKYEYSVNSKKYESSRIRFGKDTSYKSAEELDSDDFIYKVRSGVTNVYYLSSFPRLAVLKPGSDNEVEQLCAISFILSIPILLYIFKFIVNKIM